MQFFCVPFLKKFYYLWHIMAHYGTLVKSGWEQFLKNGFLLALIVVVYLQQWLKNKLVYVQCVKAVIGIL